jgi:hypothetical protein
LGVYNININYNPAITAGYSRVFSIGGLDFGTDGTPITHQAGKIDAGASVNLRCKTNFASNFYFIRTTLMVYGVK